MVVPHRNKARQVPPAPTSLSTYSDASSSYWPPGWSFNRLVYATAEDDLALPDDERTKMQAGLRDVLGEDGVGEMARVMWQEQLRLKKLEDAREQQQQPPLQVPAWLDTWRKYSRGQPWGFVAFRTSATATAMKTKSTSADEFETRVREIAEIPFDAALEQGHPAGDIAEARSTFEIRWVEVTSEEREEDGRAYVDHANAEGLTVERLRAQYRTMRESGDLPPSLSPPLLLYASANAANSVLATLPSRKEDSVDDVDDRKSKPSTTSPRWRLEAPFLLAIPAEVERGPIDDDNDADETDWSFHGGGERTWFKPVFRAAAEVLVDELWWIVERQIISLAKLTRFVREVTLPDDTPVERKEGASPVRGKGQDGEPAEEPGHNDDGLDDLWWSPHMPPHQMRKKRRIISSC